MAYNNLGGILKLQGRMPECITCYEHVAALQPSSPEALANLASAYKDSGGWLAGGGWYCILCEDVCL